MKPRLGHGQKTLRWQAGSRTESCHSLRRTAVYVTRMHGGVTRKAGDRLPMSIRRTWLVAATLVNTVTMNDWIS